MKIHRILSTSILACGLVDSSEPRGFLPKDDFDWLSVARPVSREAEFGPTQLHTSVRMKKNQLSMVEGPQDNLFLRNQLPTDETARKLAKTRKAKKPKKAPKQAKRPITALPTEKPAFVACEPDLAATIFGGATSVCSYQKGKVMLTWEPGFPVARADGRPSSLACKTMSYQVWYSLSEFQADRRLKPASLDRSFLGKNVSIADLQSMLENGIIAMVETDQPYGTMLDGLTIGETYNILVTASADGRVFSSFMNPFFVQIASVDPVLNPSFAGLSLIQEPTLDIEISEGEDQVSFRSVAGAVLPPTIRNLSTKHVVNALANVNGITILVVLEELQLITSNEAIWSVRTTTLDEAFDEFEFDTITALDQTQDFTSSGSERRELWEFVSEKVILEGKLPAATITLTKSLTFDFSKLKTFLDESPEAGSFVKESNEKTTAFSLQFPITYTPQSMMIRLSGVKILGVPSRIRVELQGMEELEYGVKASVSHGFALDFKKLLERFKVEYPVRIIAGFLVFSFFIGFQGIGKISILGTANFGQSFREKNQRHLVFEMAGIMNPITVLKNECSILSVESLKGIIDGGIQVKGSLGFEVLMHKFGMYGIHSKLLKISSAFILEMTVYTILLDNTNGLSLGLDKLDLQFVVKFGLALINDFFKLEETLSPGKLMELPSLMTTATSLTTDQLCLASTDSDSDPGAQIILEGHGKYDGIFFDIDVSPPMFWDFDGEANGWEFENTNNQLLLKLPHKALQDALFLDEIDLLPSGDLYVRWSLSLFDIPFLCRTKLSMDEVLMGVLDEIKSEVNLECCSNEHCPGGECDVPTHECKPKDEKVSPCAEPCDSGFSCDPWNGVCQPNFELVPCVAVISYSPDTNEMCDEWWLDFKRLYPHRPFCLLVPGNGADVKLPQAFLDDDLTTWHSDIALDDGNQEATVDWATLCGLHQVPQALVLYVGLVVDNSNHLGENRVAASLQLFINKMEEQGIPVKKVVDAQEEWISPFISDLGDLSSSCVDEESNKWGWCAYEQNCGLSLMNGAKNIGFYLDNPVCLEFSEGVGCCAAW